jgi:hypothetical protein
VSVEAFCECGHLNEAPDTLAGGIINCAACGRATQVPGLRDHYWTALKVAAAVGWALVTAWAYTAAGLPGALIAAVGGALVLFVLSRML